MLLGCWARGDAGILRQPVRAHRVDIHSRTKLAGATGNSPVEEVLGTVLEWGQLPWVPSSGEQAKPSPFPPVHRASHLCATSFLAPFWQSCWPSRQSIRPSVCLSIQGMG